MLRLALLTLTAAALVGCAVASSKGETKLALVAGNPFGGRAVFHLSCDPAEGDLPNPRAACSAIAGSPRLVTDPERFVCKGGPLSWWDVTVKGKIQGRSVRRSFSTCWTPQAATLRRLGIARIDVLHSHMTGRASSKESSSPVE